MKEIRKNKERKERKEEVKSRKPGTKGVETNISKNDLIISMYAGN